MSQSSALPSQVLVAAVTHGLLAGRLAAAEPGRARRLGDPLHRSKTRALVRAVAEGLAGAPAAGTPPIGLARFDLCLEGRFLGHQALVHVFPSPLPGDAAAARMSRVG